MFICVCFLHWNEWVWLWGHNSECKDARILKCVHECVCVCMNVHMFVLVMLKKCVSEDNFFQNRLQFRLKKFQIFKVKFESTWVIYNYPHLINPIAFCSQQIAFWHLLESWPASVYDWCPFLWFITSLSHFLTVRRDT